jgi:hypothetical protein
MNLRYGGRPVSWFGVGAPDAIGPGIAALQATVAQYSHRITNPGRAVADLQAAGNAAVSAVGPAIDALSGGNPDVMKLTQLAWRQNARLAAASSSGATGSDVDAVKEIVNQMIASYQEAARLAASSAPRTAAGPATASRPGGSMTPPRAPPAAPTPPPDDGSDTATWIAVGVGVFVLVVGGVVVATSRQRSAA